MRASFSSVPASLVVACSLLLSLACGCGGGRAARGAAYAASAPAFGYEAETSGSSGGGAAMASPGGPMAPGAPGSPAAPAVPQLPEQLVIEGSLRLSVTEIADLVPSLRAKVEALGGRVVEEDVSGAEADWRAHLKLRVPPAQLDAVLAWLASRGDITDKQLRATDVSRTLFDQELALKNAQLTADRLEALLRQGGLTMADVLAVERELTRLRGEIEAIKGQAQFLRDRVALSTLEVVIARKSGAVHLASAKAYPGARFAALVLLDPDGRDRTRLGGGFVLHTLFRALTLEVELYQRKDDGQGDGGAAEADESMAVLATIGGSIYSDFLGRGERELGNPYLGLRAGYGYLDSHRFVVEGEAGVELFKSERFVLDASARVAGLLGDDVDVALILGASAAVAF